LPQARDPQQLPHDTLRSNESSQINQDTAPEHPHVPDIAKIEQVDSSSGFTTELTYLHSAAPSNSQITNRPVNIERGPDDEQKHGLSLHYSNSNFEPQWRIDELDGRNPTPSRHLLQRWAYETSNINITFAERLEKSNWETTRMQRL
jgi:hypothetical protein